MRSDDAVAIKELSKEVCWSLFTSLAFVDRGVSKLRRGWQGNLKCKGLPLAIKTIGSLLRFKKTSEEWQRILNSELWNLKEFKRDDFSTLFLSYNDLPYMIRRCFLICTIFPKDYNMEKDQLIKLWIA